MAKVVYLMISSSPIGLTWRKNEYERVENTKWALTFSSRESRRAAASNGEDQHQRGDCETLGTRYDQNSAGPRKDLCW